MKNINKSSLLAIVFFSFAFLTVLALPAQKLYSLQGQITDAANDLPIAGVVVQIPGTKYKDTSNEDGFYSIKNLPPGTNVVSISAENYIAQSVTIIIKANKTFNTALESVFPQDLPKEENSEELKTSADENQEEVEIPKEETRKERKEKKEKKKKEPKPPKEKKEKKPKVKKKSKKELMAEEFAKKPIYEKEIENVVAFENLYFSEFKIRKNTTTAIGFFSVENKEIYIFTAEFEWENNVCDMKNIEIKLKGIK